jgi:glycosyltransferase involved in cell wall biosynthesis
MENVVLLTTWNRPRLLAQALQCIEREANSIGAQLVIADDHSDNEDTLVILGEAKSRGIEVIVNQEYQRMALDSPHIACGRNAHYAFNYVVENYKGIDYIIKTDDDIYLMDKAFATMHQARADAEANGIEWLAVSGIQTVNERTIEDYGTYRTTTSPCAASTIYRYEDIRIAFSSEIHQSEHMMNGWDWTFWEIYRRKWKENGKAIATCPSVAFHAGRTGTHLTGEEINQNYAGSTEGIICE